jgi:nucleoside-diphosphate-sugar epimerase
VSANRLFIFGTGTTATVLGTRLLSKGWQVTGTCRTAEKAELLAGLGFDAVLFNSETNPSAEKLADATHLLISVPPGVDGDPVLRELSKTLQDNCASLAWIGYLSTTGVYGDREGAWVDETDEMRPTSERGRRRETAERDWFALGKRLGVPVQTFRLAGIYGPGRNQIASLRAGKARRLVKPGHVFSRIHVEDIASVLEASIAQPRAGAAYNVCDDEAAPPQDVVTFAARLAGLELPPEVPFDEAELTPMARSFYDESKRVSNGLIKQELGVTLQFPSYREGLTALHNSGE